MRMHFERVCETSPRMRKIWRRGERVSYYTGMFNYIEAGNSSCCAGVGDGNGIGTYVHRHHDCDLVGCDAWSRRKSNGLEL